MSGYCMLDGELITLEASNVSLPCGSDSFLSERTAEQWWHRQEQQSSSEDELPVS